MRTAIVMLAVLGCSANDDIPSPLIAAVVPNQAPVGATVMVTGQYFCQQPDTGSDDPTCDVSGSVRFDIVPGTPSSWSDTEIMVEVPSGVIGRADVSVLAAGRTSNSVEFTVTSP